MENKHILIVDDSEINRDVLKMLLGDRYNILMAEDGEQALDIVTKYQDELLLILLDLHMPKKDGYEVMAELQKEGVSARIPILVITAENDANVESKCFELGAFDFVSKPFNRDVIIRRIENSLTVYMNRAHLEAEVCEKTKELRLALNKSQALSARLKKVNSDIVDVLGSVVEYRSVESGEHIQRVKDYTYLLGKYYQKLYPEEKLSFEQLGIIKSASALHDIGKIAISDAILLKPGRLTNEEFDEMKTHTTKGAELLQHMKHIWNYEHADYNYGEIAFNICKYHHERFDGHGYPEGLEGNHIPLCAQLVSVADVYDALVNERCYKSAFSLEKAYEMIMNGECGIFSPKILKAFEAARVSFERITRLSQRKKMVD